MLAVDVLQPLVERLLEGLRPAFELLELAQASLDDVGVLGQLCLLDLCHITLHFVEQYLQVVNAIFYANLLLLHIRAPLILFCQGSQLPLQIVVLLIHLVFNFLGRTRGHFNQLVFDRLHLLGDPLLQILEDNLAYLLVLDAHVLLYLVQVHMELAGVNLVLEALVLLLPGHQQSQLLIHVGLLGHFLAQALHVVVAHLGQDLRLDALHFSEASRQLLVVLRPERVL